MLRKTNVVVVRDLAWRQTRLLVRSASASSSSQAQARPKTSKAPLAVVDRAGPPNARHGRSDVSVTVFGATGFLARYVVNVLGKTGASIHVCTRDDDMSWRHLKPLGDYGKIVPHYISMKDEASLLKAVERSNVVINLVGKHYDTKHFPPTKINWTIEDANTRTAETVARISRRAGIQHLVHVSSLLAHPGSISRFGKAKLAGEQAVLREFPGACIVRPGTMYGEEDRFLNWYASLAITMPKMPMVNKGQATVYPVFVGDIAEVISAVAVGPDYLSTVDDVFELPGLDKLSHREVISYVFEQIHRSESVVNIPVNFGVMAARLLQMLPSPLITVDTLSVLQDSEKLNAVPRTDPATGAPKVIKGWDDISGIVPKKFAQKAFNYLHRYRTGGHFRELRDRERDAAEARNHPSQSN